MRNVPMIYHETEHGTIYCGDSLDVLKGMADESVDCCITSPPYWGLRDYGTAKWEGGDAECDHIQSENKHGGDRADRNQEGYKKQYKNICPKCGAIRKDKQLGLEKTPEEYVANMVQLFREVKRVLKDDGVLWLNLGDSYASNGCYLHSWMEKHPEKKHLHTENAEKYKDTPAFRGGEYRIKPKDLVGIPWRVALALQADGWWLRQDIIWHKPNPMPESVRDRCTKSHEYIFLLSKQARYYYDQDACREKTGNEISEEEYAKLDGRRHFHEHDLTQGMMQYNPEFKSATHPLGRNKRSVWTVATKPYKEAHFATYPPDLILPCVKTARPDAVILDPFFGSGTTGLVAVQNGRRYIGIDLNPEYCNIAAKRIDSELQQADIFMGLPAQRSDK